MIYSLTAFCKDHIALYICDYSFMKFLRCISQSRGIKQAWKIGIFLKKLDNVLIES